MMEDFFTYIIFCLLAYFVLGTIANLIEIRRLLRSYKEEKESIESKIEQAVKNSVIMIRLETNEDGVFAYRSDSSEFLAHGADFEKMIENLMARFPGKTAMVSKQEVDLAKGEQS